jgi:hypothetical protein
MTTHFFTCVIVADEEVEKGWMCIVIYWLRDDGTATVPTNQPCVVPDDENGKGVSAVLSAE